MHYYRLTGIAEPTDFEGNVISDEELLKILSYCRGHYKYRDGLPADLYLININSSDLFFLFEEGKLWSTVEYVFERKLTNTELVELLNYTSGQWSDGDGEEFEQREIFIEDKEYYISPWHQGQHILIHYKSKENE